MIDPVLQSEQLHVRSAVSHLLHHYLGFLTGALFRALGSTRNRRAGRMRIVRG
jgi:hypothetical protein